MQLNEFYKIVSWCVVLEIKTVLDYLSSDTQLKGRYFGETLDNIMFYTELKNIPDHLVFTDFVKAFDSMSW